VFEEFYGNRPVAAALEQMIRQERIPQTILLAGPEGVGKATLARRFAAALIGGAEKIERDDLSLPQNTEMLADREKWAPDKRAEDPLLLATHPDFLTFPPDGPLRQISIQQMRLLKDRARFKPLRGNRRVFLIDQIDHANEQAANSLLKTLEEPPEHLVLVLTAENPYDLLPTIRSRAVQFQLGPVPETEVRAFLTSRGMDSIARRAALCAGSPGLAASLDIGAYDRRRAAMLALLGAASRLAPYGSWIKHSETISASKTERLEWYLKVLYGLLEDLLWLHAAPSAPVRNADAAGALSAIAGRVSFEWLRQAARRVDEIVYLLRRNIQKGIALDALVLELRAAAAGR
jgi:DNA polymerase-3 subunit delta'